MPIAPFTLVDQNEHPFGTDQLRGKVWIADVFFTSCPDICPVQTSQMANLQRHLPHDIWMVSVSVDPEVDTPERMRDYASRYHADLSRWSFLTGERDAVIGATTTSLRLGMGDRSAGETGYSIGHSSRFLLIDRNLKLRGIYETNGDGMTALESDARWLLEHWATLLLLVACDGTQSFEQPVELGGVTVQPDVLNRGEFGYMRYCRGCHGQHGHADGPYASTLTPRPRDLTLGEYPRLGATGGDLPTDAQLHRLIREGIPGTGMGPLPMADEDREAIVQYIKTLAPVWRRRPQWFFPSRSRARPGEGCRW
jgi:protein SCO1